MFRIEWWAGRKQSVRTDQTADNIRELLDVIPPRSDVRIIDQIGGILCDPTIFRGEHALT